MRVQSERCRGRVQSVRQIIDKLVAEIDRSETPALAELQTGLRQLVERLLAGAAPREALLNLARILETRPDLLDGLGSPLATRAFASVLSSGPALTGLIARAPERLQLLQDPRLGQAWGRNRLKEALLEVVARSCADATLDRWPIDQIALGIATFRNDQFVRLAACEFGISPLEQVGRELSDLADVCLEVALSAAAAHHRGADWSMNRLMSDVEGIVAIAMGKHGACELNFCSDIDLVFIYDTDERGIAGVGSHEYHSRVCREVVKLLSALTSEGVAFRVDLRLRPEGSRGPICNSLGSAERYYETWGGRMTAWPGSRREPLRATFSSVNRCSLS
jgi:glutamate-ammonia-ligase adenylyltransferase